MKIGKIRLCNEKFSFLNNNIDNNAKPNINTHHALLTSHIEICFKFHFWYITHRQLHINLLLLIDEIINNVSCM